MRILFWFRKDLRLSDNTGLAAAARDAAGDVVPFYTSEPSILGRPDMAGTRVRFVLECLADLAAACERAGSSLALAHGEAVATVVAAARAARADAVYWNDEYEPEQVARDAAVERALGEAGVRVRRFHDRLLVPPGAVRTGGGKPYSVFTPFRRACEALPIGLPLPAVTRLATHELPRRPLATLEALGFSTTAERWPGGVGAAEARLDAFAARGLRGYASRRDLVGEEGTSRLSADLRFGTLSPRQIAAAAREALRADRSLHDDAVAFVNELRWRDFFAHVLYEFPHVANGAFRREYDAVAWEGSDAAFDAWMGGNTGYPMVDAAMRQLRSKGWMHNRARMIVASFLTKDLLVDWRRGERHFMRHLVDGDPASNNGGWQWAASTGTDAQPYFRIFNPTMQGKKFDPEGAYVKRYVPELANVPAKWIHEPWLLPSAERPREYCDPIVEHAEARERAIELYRAASHRER